MSNPKVVKMPGNQSTKLMWTGTVSYGASAGGFACAERVQASKKIAWANAN